MFKGEKERGRREKGKRNETELEGGRKGGKKGGREGGSVPPIKDIGSLVKLL